MANAEQFWDSRIETISRDELRVLQDHRLQWQVRRCWEGSAFYHERLAAAGLEPADVRGLDDLARIPVLKPEVLELDRRAHHPLGRATVAPEDWWHEPSDGRLPDSVTGVWTEADIVHRVGLAARALWSFGVRPGDVVANRVPAGSRPLSPTIDAAIRTLGTHPLQHSAPPAAGSRVIIVASGGPAVGPTSPATSRSGVVDAEPDLLAIWDGVGGGPASVGRTRRAGRTPTLRAYGGPELGPTLAAECEAGTGLHWAEDHVIVEVLDPATLDAAPIGQPGALVLSHLTREGSPLIRYWTGAFARLDPSPCPCGRTLARSPGGVLTNPPE